MRVLIIEDADAVGFMFSQLLRKHGWETAVTGSVDLATTLLKTGCFDLVIKDLFLPILEKLPGITKLREACDAPILVLTGNGDTKGDCIHAGADGYGVKPIGEVDLLGMVQETLNAADRRRGKATSYEGADPRRL